MMPMLYNFDRHEDKHNANLCHSWGSKQGDTVRLPDDRQRGRSVDVPVPSWQAPVDSRRPCTTIVCTQHTA